MPGPLTGMTVIEVSAFIAAPYAGLNLAQMGAEVIRIDPIGGGLDYNRWPVTNDGESLYWAGLNKGKKSVTLNVRDPKGRELAHNLMTTGGPGKGIVVTNLPARGWLDYDGLKAKRDDLIMVNIVGRRDGSVALDYTVNARTGFPLITGPVGTKGPVNHVMPVWDVVTALAASNAVLVADRHRRDTGEGQYVRIALADSAFAVLSHLGYVAEAQINQTDRPATGNHVFGTFGCDFPTSDGRRVMITAFTPRHWLALLEATGLEERFAALAAEKGVDLSREEERYALRETIEAELAPWFAARSLSEIGKALDAVGACWGPYQTVRQAVAEDPDLSAENPMFTEIEQPGIGRYLAAGSFIDFSGIPREPAVPAPTLGSNTESVLTEKLGLTDSDLSTLKDDGVI
ncbi:MAG: 2-methylfumaryl-CoA isomerase [Rhodospirillaceae bacterium]|nr:2-methylfumaryl-CoA isomerase [Rhodospirillaceae bacterium]